MGVFSPLAGAGANAGGGVWDGVRDSPSGVFCGYNSGNQPRSVASVRRAFSDGGGAFGGCFGGSVDYALRRKFPEARFSGVGGERMAGAGCTLIANPVGGSAMFLRAVVTRSAYWWRLLKRIDQEFRTAPPEVVIPIDSSAINLRIAAVARKRGLPVCYYVAPQIWASRPWRIEKIRRRVNTLCCILPFEEKYFRERGVNAVYVGHPMFDQAAESVRTDPRGDAAVCDSAGGGGVAGEAGGGQFGAADCGVSREPAGGD